MSGPIDLGKGMTSSINHALRELHAVGEEFPKMEECGIDCTDMRVRREHAIKHLEAIRQHYTGSGKGRGR